MKKAVLFGMLLACNYCFAQSNRSQDKVQIIPEPVSLNVQNGFFTLNGDTKIYYGNEQLARLSRLFVQSLNKPTGYDLSSRPSGKKVGDNAILLEINEKRDDRIGEEGYTLQVSPKQVFISANTTRGVFYGLQSFMQILPAQIESKTLVQNILWKAHCVRIVDYPRFQWRGLMVDESRHFFGKNAIEQFIDEMAKYKYNVFHWHLTDDEGWRLEIKGLPRLTQVGAWRVPRTGTWGTFEAPQPGEKATDGGYYTQEEIKEVIRYAKDRFITILPEIDVPAHCLALIASYPGLSCTRLSYPVWPQHVPRGIDNVLDVANDSTWIVLDTVFAQVARLFPCPYIHVGGDEANRSFWMKDTADLMLMKREGITTPAGLQSYFEKRLEKMIVSKGKKMIGWDEILDGGIAPEATIMSWRGTKGGIVASQMGHQVIMSPYGRSYLSQRQGDPAIEPRGPGLITLQKCYEMNLVPKGADPKFILGGEGCLWSEHIPYYRHLFYMAYPRALALSEVLWSPGDAMNWNNFVDKVQEQFAYLKAAQIKYATSIYDPAAFEIKDGDGSVKIVLSTQLPALRIYYTFDDTDPDNFYPEYTGEPLSIPKGATFIKAMSYREGRPVGRQGKWELSKLTETMKK